MGRGVIAVGARDSASHYLERELFERLRTEPGLFEFLQQGSLDGIWYWDLESRDNEWMSARFWGVLGYDPGEKAHLASEWQSVIFHEDLEVALANLDAHLADPDQAYDQVVRYRHKNGSTVWVRCRGIAIRDAEGRAIRMLGAHNDVTALKQAEKEVREQLEQLKRASRETALAQERERRRIAVAIHDGVGQLLPLIRTKLNLLMRESDPSGRKRLTEIDGLILEAHTVAADISSKLSPPILAELSLGGVVRQLADEMKQRFGLQVTLTPDFQMEIETDLQLVLHSCIRELLINVAKHAGVDSAHVRLEHRDEQLRVVVADEGRGFEPTTTGATSLGLRSAHERLEYLGGRRDIQSQPGRGTRAILTLPLSPNPGGDPGA